MISVNNLDCKRINEEAFEAAGNKKVDTLNKRFWMKLTQTSQNSMKEVA